MEKIKQTITLTHVNIRESISILLIKIFVIDILAATMIMISFSLVMLIPDASFPECVFSYHTVVFILLGFLKISLTVYIVLLWLNEYFELTPTEVIHYTGVIFHDEKRFRLEYVRTIKLSQSVIGKWLNFGTITLYDIREHKREELYLIHNPHRYLRILEKLIGDRHEEKQVFHPHLFSEESEDELEDKGEYKDKKEYTFT